MNEIERRQQEIRLVTIFKDKLKDIVAHIDFVEKNNELIISFFWNRLSRDHWKDHMSFKSELENYEKTIQNDIIAYFDKL